MRYTQRSVAPRPRPHPQLSILCIGLVAAAIVGSAGFASAQVLPSLIHGYQAGPPCSDHARSGFGLGSPSGFVGTLLPNRGEGQFHEIESEGASVNGLVSARHKYPQRGLWVGASQTVSLPVDVDVVLEGWYLFPSQYQSVSRYNFVGGAGVGTSKDWGKVQANSWFADASMLFSWAPTWRRYGWSQINGVRFDIYERTLEDPEDVVGFVPAWPSAPSDRVDMRTTMVIPYIGLQARGERTSYGGTFRIIVSPLVFGSVRHEEIWGGPAGRHEEGTLTFNRGTFAELFLNAVGRPSENVSVGFFMKFSAISAYGSGDLDGSIGGGATESAGFEVSFRKIAYIMGGTFSLDFGSPF